MNFRPRQFTLGFNILAGIIVLVLMVLFLIGIPLAVGWGIFMVISAFQSLPAIVQYWIIGAPAAILLTTTVVVIAAFVAAAKDYLKDLIQRTRMLDEIF